MGRSPCCDKVGLKKGPWTPEEDQKLVAYIEEHGHGSWRALPTKAGLQRCGKSCRLRWTNYLRPDIKRGKFSLQEEQTIIQLHALLGNRWSAIATHLPKRTDNEIKNYWNTHLKKRLAKMGIDPVTHKPKSDTLLSTEGGGAQPKHSANLSHMAQWESARLEAEARLVRQSKLRSSNTTSPNPFNTTSIFASPSSSGPPLNQPILPAAPPRCLDVLKALNGGWIKQNEAGLGGCTGTGDGDGGGGGVSVMGISRDHHLESPTSTLSYSENAPQGSNVTTIGESSNAFMELVGNSSGSEEAEKDWKRFENSIDNSISLTSGLNNMAMTMENSWTTQESLRAKTDEYVPCGNFVERFTDLLLSGSGGGRSFSEDDGDTDNGGSRGNGGTNSDYCADDKNYWDSILSLVNSSPSNSPVF